MPKIRLETIVPASPQACFELSLSVDAHTASMRDSGERAVAGVTSGVMRLGDTVTWRARHFGVPFTMTSRISAYEAPRRFVDEQVSGPFGRWYHEHLFTPDDGGTSMVDVVEFASPLGLLGQAVDGLSLARYMTGLLELRNRWLVENSRSPVETRGHVMKKVWYVIPTLLLLSACGLQIPPRDGSAAPADGDDWVVVSYPVTGGDPAMMQLLPVEEAADEALQDAGAGEIDGNEVGQGTYEMFFVGADRDEMWRVLEPVLQRSPTAWTSAEVRHGLDDENPRVVRP